MQGYSMSTYRGVRNFKKNSPVLAHPVVVVGMTIRCAVNCQSLSLLVRCDVV